MTLYSEELEQLNILISNIMLNMKNDINEYQKLYEIIYNSLDNLNNYQILYSILRFRTKFLYKEINNFLSKDNKSRLSYLIDIYNNMKNEMTIIYNRDKNSSNLRLFGKRFVKNNKNNCSLLTYFKSKIKYF